MKFLFTLQTKLPHSVQNHRLQEIFTTANSVYAQLLLCSLKSQKTGFIFNKKGNIIMLSWSISFFVIAIIAAVFGFGGIAGSASSIAQILFLVFLVLAVVSFIRGRTPKA